MVVKRIRQNRILVVSLSAMLIFFAVLVNGNIHAKDIPNDDNDRLSTVQEKPNIKDLPNAAYTKPKHWAHWLPGDNGIEVGWSKGNVDPPKDDLNQLWRQDSSLNIWLPVKDISDSDREWEDTNVSMELDYRYQLRVYDPAVWDWIIIAETEWARRN